MARSRKQPDGASDDEVGRARTPKTAISEPPLPPPRPLVPNRTFLVVAVTIFGVWVVALSILAIISAVRSGL